MKTGENNKSNSVFIVSVLLILAIVSWGLFAPSHFETAGNAAYQFIGGNFAWFYVLIMTIFVVFCIWIGFFSNYKNVKLGPDDSRPEYTNLAWFGMLFSAGMGIGLVFWGVAEPLNFYLAPLGCEPGTLEAARFAFQKSFLHWGLHPWAGYSVLAMALAYFQYRKGKPGLISTVFIPLIGEERVKGWIGKTIDVLAIFATAAGIATSLGLGAYQINSGLHFVYGIPESPTVQFVIIAVISVIYIWTAIAGVDKGIKKICDINIILAGLILLFTFLIGPTREILNTLVEGIGVYLGTFVQNTLEAGAFGDSAWYGKWTIFYWAWWIAWAPFSALFIARISKGRTIKEFVTGVLFVPTGASFVWFSVFGQAGISAGVEVAKEAIQSTSTALFVVLNEYPLGSILSTVVIVVLCTFFITSANSATFVLGMLSSQGDLNPPNSKKIVWGVLQSVLALSLMLGTSNGLQMLQTISIVGAFPFGIVLILTMFSFVKALKEDHKVSLLEPKGKQLQNHDKTTIIE